jgi:hypothetical protein
MGASSAGSLLAADPSGVRLSARRWHHRRVAGRVFDPFLQPHVATVQHALGGGIAVIVAIGPQLVEERLGTLFGLLAGQFGELECLALALGVLALDRVGVADGCGDRDSSAPMSTMRHCCCSSFACQRPMPWKVERASLREERAT